MFEDSSVTTPSSSSSVKDSGPKVVEGCLSSMTRELPFSSGNPTIEETRGVMHLFRDDVVSSVSKLPVERKTLICVLGVPNHMTYADFCQFCGSFIQHMQEMRVVRINDMDDRYSVLIRFDGQDSTDDFYKHFNGQKFSSLEVETCHVLFMIDVLYTGSIEHAHASILNSSEQPTCPVCLEILDQDSGGILTTICNHSFHCSCISRWTDSSCPVCRYCQQQPEKSICFICQTSENLWMCVICGFVGCGRYKEGHAITHWKETQHCYSLEVETQRVWDYAGDNYVHRLIQSKTDGKLVELNARCSHADSGCDTCNCSEDPAFKEAVWNSKVEVIVNEYNELLSTQLEKQKLYYESLLQEVNDETEREISEAVEKAVSLKCEKLQAKLHKCVEEKKFHDDINENLLKNQEILQRKIREAEERMKKSVQLKDDKILDLEAEIDRIARVAFEIARQRGSKLCSVDKANVLEASMLWRRRVEAIALEYPDVKLSHMYVDNAAMQLLRDPKQFDTIVTNNIFGDILSDEASMVSGSIGMLPSASLSDSGPGIFEPIHGSAPDIAGQDKANPLATILSAAMLLRYGLLESEAAERIENAVLNTLDKGCRTGDIFSAGHRLVGCKEMGEEVMKSVESL